MSSTLGDVLLVGSVPFETVEDVLGTCAHTFGARAFALPDGEIGVRSTWIMALPTLSYAKNPDLDILKLVPLDQVKSPDSHDPALLRATCSTFRLKPGITETRFDLPYASEALKSYEIFCRLRDRGAIADGVRFQVAMPFTLDAIGLFFPHAEDHPVVMRAYEQSVRATIDEILRHIPAADLVIQWDYCSELLEILGARDKYAPKTAGAQQVSTQERFERYTSAKYLAPLSETIPAEVLIGYHLCYGTWGGWPMGEVTDIGFCVRLANALVANTPRRVDFVHLPVMPRADDAFFRPLADLRIGKTKVFLGIELADGVEAMVRRAQIARKYLPAFGVSHYCGYGREKPARVRELLADLRRGAEQLAG